MTEAEARRSIAATFGVSRETMLARFIELVKEESARQNLVSAASLATMWRRHILDSAQLVPLAQQIPGRWIDIGTGAGFPGMVVAAITDRPVTLIEPRRKRADFLAGVAAALGLSDRVEVIASRAEQHRGKAAVVSARAVAPLTALLDAGVHLSTRNTLWLLPKGARALEEVAIARQTWHGVFHVEHSMTEPGSLIITAKGVARR